MRMVIFSRLLRFFPVVQVSEAFMCPFVELSDEFTIKFSHGRIYDCNESLVLKCIKSRNVELVVGTSYW